MRDPFGVKTKLEEKDQIENLKKYIASAEESLEAAKKALFELTGEEFSKGKSSLPRESLANLKVAEGGKIIEGIFDGENMVGPEGKVYPIPANYASKSKLVEGDKLKLTVAEDGSFIFKQIGPAERKKIIGNLSFENNAYHVSAEGQNYNVLYASVTYFKAKPGDRVTIVVPSAGNSEWAAVENVIHEVKEESEGTLETEENLLESESMPQSELKPVVESQVENALPKVDNVIPIQSEPTSDVQLSEETSQTPKKPATEMEI